MRQIARNGAVRVLADNLAALLWASAAQQADLPARSRRCNRIYVATLLRRLLTQIVLLIGDFITTFDDHVRPLGETSQGCIAGRSRPRPAHHVKPPRWWSDLNQTAATKPKAIQSLTACQSLVW